MLEQLKRWKVSHFFALALVIFAFSGCDLIDRFKGEENSETSNDELLNEIESLKNQVEDLEAATFESDKEKVIESYITLNSPANGDSFHEEPVIFTGSVSQNTEKIVATAYYTSLSFNEELGKFEQTDKTDVYTLQQFEPGNTSFTYRASMDWNNLGVDENDYMFTAYFSDGTQKSTSVSIFYEMGGMGKPVIYLYPEETQKVFVNVEPNGGFLVSDPEIHDGWNVIASPSGRLFNLGDFRTYPYLFWEGLAVNFKTSDTDGFVIAQKDLPNFFDEKLGFLGLNEKEIADFKEYWIPELNEKPYYMITFLPQKEFDKYAPLTVYPKPDSVIRVFFDYKGLDAPVELTEQILEKGVREGFTVTEWGGRLYWD